MYSVVESMRTRFNPIKLQSMKRVPTTQAIKNDGNCEMLFASSRNAISAVPNPNPEIQIKGNSTFMGNVASEEIDLIVRTESLMTPNAIS